MKYIPAIKITDSRWPEDSKYELASTSGNGIDDLSEAFVCAAEKAARTPKNGNVITPVVLKEVKLKEYNYDKN